jgi:hypothetical protein
VRRLPRSLYVLYWDPFRVDVSHGPHRKLDIDRAAYLAVRVVSIDDRVHQTRKVADVLMPIDRAVKNVVAIPADRHANIRVSHIQIAERCTKHQLEANTNQLDSRNTMTYVAMKIATK